MASKDFKKWADKFAEDFNASAGDKGSRKEVQGAPLTLVMIDQNPVKKTIDNTFQKLFDKHPESARKKAAKQILTDMKTNIKTDLDVTNNKNNKVWNKLSEAHQKELLKQKRKATGWFKFGVIVPVKFNSIQKWKAYYKREQGNSLLKSVRSGIMEHLKVDIYADAHEAELRELGGVGKEGLQLEHGAGTGLAASSVRVLGAEARLDEANIPRGGTEEQIKIEREAVAKFKKIVTKYKSDMKIKVSRTQVVDSNGNVKCTYLPVVTLTSASSNQKEKDREVAMLKAVQKGIDDLVATKGSETIDEMVRDTTLHNINGNGKGRKTKGAGKPRKKVSNRSKGATRAKLNEKESLSIIDGVGAAIAGNKIVTGAKGAKNKGRAAPRAGAAPGKSGSSKMPLHLIGIINKDLPDTVRANMGAPALTNQTGRFASSVRATDMNMTPQGFPSIGYTYQRDPYGTFEQDHDYDPRRLIDQSMREIAAQHAMGRFYTRRV